MPLNSHGIPKNLTDLSMLPDATNVALCPNLTPVAIAVWSLNEISSCHCLHRYTLYKWISKFTIYHFSCNGLVSSLRIFQISFLKILCFRIQILTWHPIQLHWGMFHSGQRPGTSPEARCTISIQKHRKQSKKMQIQTCLASSSSRRNSIIEDNLCFSDLQLYLIFVCKLKSLEILQFSQIPKFDNRIFSWCSQVVS